MGEFSYVRNIHAVGPGTKGPPYHGNRPDAGLRDLKKQKKTNMFMNVFKQDLLLLMVWIMILSLYMKVIYHLHHLRSLMG